MVRDLDLSKQAAEILASRLNEKHVLHSSAKVAYFRKSDELFITFLKEEKQLIYCDNVPGLFGQLGILSYNSEEWRLFMDSSKRSLKCVLLHNGENYGAVPIGHSTVLKEQQQDIRTVMNLLKYHEHNWIICVDAQSWTALFRAFSSHRQPSASLTKLLPSWTRLLAGLTCLHSGRGFLRNKRFFTCDA